MSPTELLERRTRARANPARQPPRQRSASNPVRSRSDGGSSRTATARSRTAAPAARRTGNRAAAPARRLERPSPRPPVNRMPPRRGRAARRAKRRVTFIRWRAGSPNRRLWVIAVGAVLAFAIVLGRVGQLQLAEGGYYSALGDRQTVRTQPLQAVRGALVDRNGVELAVSVPQHAVYADPSLIPDPVAAANLLAPILGQDSAELAAKLSGDGQFVYLRRQVDDATVAELDALRDDPAARAALTGIAALPEPKRFLPAGDVGRALIGSVNPDGVGQAGLEQAWNEALAGTPGELRREVDQGGRTIASSDSDIVPSDPGSTVVTTIDRALQYELERATVEYVEDIQAKGGMVIVQDVKSGDVLALVNVDRADDGTVRTTAANLAFTAPFEPGSVNKVITVAAAIDQGLVSPETRFNLPARYTYQEDTEWEKVFTDAHQRGDVNYSVRDILTYSSNVGTVVVAEQLQEAGLDAAMRNFGLGEVTGSTFPNESRGIYPKLEDWSGTSLPTIAMGQGVAVTAMQMLSVYTAIANGGVWRSPRLVSATIDPRGQRHEVEPAQSRRVMSELTAQTMVSLLRDVVTAGTGANADIEGYSVAGKTGTALKAQSNGTYEDEQGVRHYVGSFNGVLPAEDPQLSIAVVIDEPPGDNFYAADVAAPLFKIVGQEALRQLRIPPPALTPVPGP